MALLSTSKARSRRGTRRGRFLRRTLIVLAALFVLYNLVSFLVVPPLARSIAEKNLTAALHRDVTIESVRFNPYVLSIRVRKLFIGRKEGTGHFVAFDELYANAQLSSVFKRAPVIKEVALVNPSVYVERNEDLTFSFSDLIPPKDAAPAVAEEEQGPPVTFRIDRIRIENGQVRLNDKPVGVTHSITGINLDVLVVSNMEDFVEKAVSPAFSAVVNGAPLKVGADSKPFVPAMETGMRIDLERIDLPFYFGYLPAKVNFRPVSGLLTIHLAADFKRTATGKNTLQASGKIDLENLELVEASDAPLLKIPRLHIVVAPSSVLENQATVSAIRLEAPEIHVRRGREGILNLATLVPPSPPAETDAGAEPDAPEAEDDAAPWLVRLDDFELSDGMVFVRDESGTVPVEMKVDHVAVLLKNVSTAQDERGTASVSFRLDETCSFNTSGDLGIAPPVFEMDIALKDLALAAFQGYVPPALDILVADGRLGVDGKVIVALKPGEPLAGSYEGSVNLADLSVTDRAGNEKFLNLEALDLAGIHAQAEPLAIAVDSVALTNVQSDLRVDENGTLNLQRIVRPAHDEEDVEVAVSEGEAETAPVPVEAAETAPAPSIRVGRFRIDGGKIAFADHSVSPEYFSSLSDFDVTIEGITPGSKEPLSLAWRSTLDDYASLSLDGKAALDPDTLYLDIGTQLKNLSTARLSPYSRKFIGYDIDEGKLTLDLDTRIEDGVLTAENGILLDQFDLGEKTDPSKLKGMPVGLAIAILKDRRGQIKLSIPVRGRLDDPEFRLGQVIARFLMGLLEKAATSPFALLGSVLPGGESLSYVEFAPGASGIGPQGEEKLNTLVGALYDRPSLKLVIVPYVDYAADSETIRRAALMGALGRRKAADSAAEGEEPPEYIADVLPDEYDSLIRSVFRADGFDRLAPDARSVADMELVLLAHFSPGESELRELAARRAEAIRDFVIATEKVEAERVSIADPASLGAEEREGIAASRVEFALE